MRGDARLDKAARASLGGGAAEVEYHGGDHRRGRREARWRGSRRACSCSARASDVRRVIDLARGEDESLRSSAADRALRDAFAPRARRPSSGRPAIIAALRCRRRRCARSCAPSSCPAADLEWLSVALAVGDGFDVGARARRARRRPRRARWRAGAAGAR